MNTTRVRARCLPGRERRLAAPARSARNDRKTADFRPFGPQTGKVKPMKKFTIAAFSAVAALALSACGSSDSASEEAQADNVEMPAEEAMGDVEATPVPDASAAADAGAAMEPAAAPAEAPKP